MGNLKTVFWIFIFGFVALLFFQNQEVFLTQRTLRMDLFFAKYQTPAIPDILLFFGTFVVGFLIAYFFSLSSRFRLKKIAKQLNGTVEAQKKEINALKSEIDGLKADAHQPQATETVSEQPAPETELAASEVTADEPKAEDEGNKTDS